MKNRYTKNTGYKVGIVLKSGEVIGKSVNTREEADDFILNTDEVKVAIILNRKTKEKEIVRF